jgi:hypothetical protein
MKKILRLIVLLGLVASARAQIDTELIRPELDQNDLFARAAASRLVIIGTVIKTEGKSEGISDAAALERLHNGKDYRASLYTIRVEEIIGRQSDFDSRAPRVDDRPQPFYLFVPFDESELPDGHYREVLLPNRRYLLLLTELDSAALAAKYKLDPNRIYYRGTGHNRGVIPLEPETPAGQAPKPPEVLDKFRRLCDAMRPPKPADKLGLLEKLTDSGDPVLQKEAEIAKASVQASMQHTESQGKQPKRDRF